VRALVMFEERIDGASSETGKARQLIVLTALARLALLVDRRTARRVSACRREGASWADIARALRVTRQTAYERYRHLAAGTD
jgi:hypothetical protein